MSIYGIPVGAPAIKAIERTDLSFDVQVSLDKADNALSQDTLQDGINTALAQAKECGEFNGKDGDDGIGIADAIINTTNELVLTFSDNTEKNLGVVVGKNGYTPQKNVDYFDGEKGDPFTYEDFTPEQLASLKGDIGDSGVHTGTTPPLDESAKVWINPNGEPDVFVKSVNSISPDENGNVEIEVAAGGGEQWEKIETITLTEDVSELAINTEGLKAVTIQFTGCFNNTENTATDAAATGIIETKTGRAQYSGQLGFVRNNRSLTSVYAYKRINALMGEIYTWHHVANIGGNKTGTCVTFPLAEEGKIYIKPDNSMLIKAGGNFEIWGVRE